MEPVDPDSLFDEWHETEVRVRYAETDQMGVVYHANYLVWFEIARIDYLARFEGGYPALLDAGVDATTVEANVRYRAPARFGDGLRIGARCLDVRGARFRFEYAVRRDGALLADGWTAHACVDTRTLRPTRVDAIAAAEA
jgi:acyl-CoA thioester hydrolase